MDSPSAYGMGFGREARWSLRLFGGFELSLVRAGERVTLPRKRERVLLAYLALSPNCRQSRRKLAALLWDDASEQTASENLRTALWSVRKALGDADHRLIASEGEDVLFDASAFDVDVSAFRRLAVQSGLTALEEAAKLYRGGFLDGLAIESEEFESWRRSEGGRLKDMAVDALTRLMMQLADAGETDRAIEAGLRVLSLDPLHEAAVRRLMRLYGERGQRGAAVQLFHTLSEVLRTELDAQPEADTRAVFAEVAHVSEKRTPDRALAADVNAKPTISSADVVHSLSDASSAIGVTQKLVVQNVKTRALGWIAAGVAAALAVFLLYQFAPTTGATTAQEQTGVEAAKAAASSSTGAISIAVLPFVNLSGDVAQEFFSDGITEEVTNALVQIPDLRVVARTSAYQFKGEKKDARAVGLALGVTHLIEGSVRKRGNRVRIRAELIKADDGAHLWAQSYDRDLTDIVAIQEDIARAIAASFRMPLGLAPGQRLVSRHSIDPESYQQYLRARPLMRARERGVPAATEILETVVARNPDYAPAWALLSRAYAYVGNLQGSQKRRRIDEFWPKAEAAAQRAIQLDPNLADSYLALGSMAASRGKLVTSEDLRLKAIALDPNNPDALQQYIPFLSNVGRLKEALAMAQQLRALEPYVPAFNNDVGEILWENGQDAAAIEMLTPLTAIGRVPASLAMIYASQGRYKEAADILEPMAARVPEAIARQVRTATGVLRTAPAKAADPESIPKLCECALSFVFLHVGVPERALEWYEGAAESGNLAGSGGDVGFLWHPSFAPVRNTERFKTFIRNGGYVAYWHERGWPDICRPRGTSDFVCD